MGEKKGVLERQAGNTHEAVKLELGGSRGKKKVDERGGGEVVQN